MSRVGLNAHRYPELRLEDLRNLREFAAGKQVQHPSNCHDADLDHAVCHKPTNCR